MSGEGELTFAAAVAAHNRDREFRPHDHAHEYYQASLLSAVMQGVYDGKLTIGELLKHGDFGLGTFNALDGEMIVHEGVAYRLTADGKAARASDDDLTPYAAVLPFEPDLSLAVMAPVDKAEFERGLDEIAQSPNLFYAVRFTGRIGHIKYRNVSRQEPPYKPLLEVVKTQAEFELEDVSGTILGFRCPDYAVGIGVPGYHLHFISEDLTTGGHVLNYSLVSGRLEIDHTASLHLELPDSGSFLDTDIAPGAAAADIRSAEGE
ncbi:acetolactate decarboxylase [Ruegeria sediminis]|uniref:Alpha-acetolactate decarboxylase n=1 Tax=Ruegeria sediminis TaxID=2583820 RepID=A0ABY2WVY7_9RHOB|nr:acetolactate decarboxylase [Ruegeria sediminis]TMV06525.1 acetolactate decarboxylase [Ruegeria sediminis]